MVTLELVLDFYAVEFIPPALGATWACTWAVQNRDFRRIGYGGAGLFVAMALYWPIILEPSEPDWSWQAALLGALSIVPTVVVSSLVTAFLVRIHASPVKAGFAVLALNLLIIPADAIAMLLLACGFANGCSF